MVNGKNEPILKELYTERTGKKPLTKAGSQSKDYLDWKRSNFKAMKQTVKKNFRACTPDIDAGNMSNESCFETAYDKAVEHGSLYISPAIRTKKRDAELEAKYNYSALEEAFKKKYGIK